MIRLFLAKGRGMLKQLKTITVTNNKGGVGKTTVTRGLGQALAKKGRSVLLIDSDPQGNLSRRCGYEPKDYDDHSLYNCLDALLKSEKFDVKDHIKEVEKNMDLLPGDIRLNLNRNEVARVFIKANFVYKKLIDKIRDLGTYDFIIIDTSPSVGDESTQIMVASDYVMIPTTTGRDAIEGIENVINNFNEIRAFNPRLELLGIVFNAVNMRGVITKDIMPVMGESYKGYLFKTVIERSVVLEKYEWGGSLGPDSSKTSQAFASLAKEVLKKIGK